MKFGDLLIAILTGIGIGIPITLICMISIGGWNAVVMEFLVWTVASGLFGALSFFIFKNDMIKPTFATILHCVGCLLITLGACAVIGYGDSFFEILLAIVPVFIVIYVLIIVVGSVSMKINAKKVNEALDRK